MKGKILIFIMGILVGAIIATTGFLIYNKTVSNSEVQPEMQMNGDGQMEGGQPGNMGESLEKPSGDNMQEPPEKPSGDNMQEPPEKPEEVNNNLNN